MTRVQLVKRAIMADNLERGMQCYQEGNFEQAVFLLGQALEEEPQLVEAKLWLGATMVAQRQSDKATFLFKRVLKESSDPEVRNYAIQMLQQLGVEVPVEVASPLRPLKVREVSFNTLMREVCLLEDEDLKAVLPWFEKYVLDLKAFVEDLKPGFVGNDSALAVLEGLLNFSSPRRQGECKSRIQSFIHTPDRVREQILGSYQRSFIPGNQQNIPRP